MSALRFTKGFTLVELLVVISIIAFLVALSITTFTGLQSDARDAKRKSDLKFIQSGLEQYHTDKGFYPSSNESGLSTGWGLLVNNSIPLTSNIGLTPTPTSTAAKVYLAKPPVDPNAAEVSWPTYCYRALDYNCTNADMNNLCTKYELFGKLENTDNINTGSIFTVKDAFATGTTTIGSLTPNNITSTVNTPKYLTATYYNSDSYANIKNAYIFITANGGTTAPYIWGRYDVAQQKFYIHDSNYGANCVAPTPSVPMSCYSPYWRGNFIGGVNNQDITLNNFTLTSLNTNTGGTGGNYLTINWFIIPIIGSENKTYTVFLRAQDNNSPMGDTGWEQKGTWMVNPAVLPTSPPPIVTIGGGIPSPTPAGCPGVGDRSEDQYSCGGKCYNYKIESP